jgi:cell division protein FtsB
LEFSFDRSNVASSQKAPQNSGPLPKSETPKTESHADGIDTSTIANERLRKAIEKNRARQAERVRMTQAPDQSQNNEQASLFDKKQEQPQETIEEQVISPPPRARAEERTHVAPKSSPVVTRRSAARPNEAEFTPVKRAPRKVASQISYTTNSRKKSKPIDPKLVSYLVKGSWIFCGLMILRLIFANGGITDFYSQRSLHTDRLDELVRIKKENMSLVQEIERMQTDSAFQKKLVRDNLGFIAADEYLVLFPKEK